MKIRRIGALELLDSRGYPTVGARIHLENGTTASALVPSGASTGENEAVELRDGDPSRYCGKGVKQAVQNIRTEITEALKGMDVSDQEAIDQRLIERRTKTTNEMIDLWRSWIDDYPIVLIEDPLAENDWEGWARLTKTLGDRIELVGDDIFCTNREILQKAIEQGVGNSILIKLNQIGTVTETLKCVRLAQRHDYGVYVSHRSGETEDTFIADLAVATGCGHIKAGSGCRGERIAKFNRLLRIEDQLGDQARFAGLAGFKKTSATSKY